MSQKTLSVGQIENAGYGDFVPVTIVANGKEYGCDAHLGTGTCTERGFVVTRELIDWQDGNGLLYHDLATSTQVWEAVNKAVAQPKAVIEARHEDHHNNWDSDYVSNQPNLAGVVELIQNCDSKGRIFGYVDGWFVNYFLTPDGIGFELEADYGDGKSEHPLTKGEANRSVAAAIAGLDADGDTACRIRASLK